MASLAEFMSDDHRHCDDLFAATEKSVSQSRWDEASGRFERFRAAMEAHLSSEEEVLFPAFEAASGMSMGPTQVMRMEHAQLRELLGEMEAALAARDQDAYLGQAETLLIMMQQHNMKEEGILYPMCDSHLARSADELTGVLRARLPAHA